MESDKPTRSIPQGNTETEDQESLHGLGRSESDSHSSQGRYETVINRHSKNRSLKRTDMEDSGSRSDDGQWRYGKKPRIESPNVGYYKYSSYNSGHHGKAYQPRFPNMSLNFNPGSGTTTTTSSSGNGTGGSVSSSTAVGGSGSPGLFQNVQGKGSHHRHHHHNNKHGHHSQGNGSSNGNHNHQKGTVNKTLVCGSPSTSVPKKEAKKPKKAKKNASKVNEDGTVSLEDPYGGLKVSPGFAIMPDPKREKFPGLRDVRELILWIFTNSVRRPNWIFVKNKSCISNVLVIVLSSLDAKTYERHVSDMPFISQFFSVESFTMLRPSLTGSRIYKYNDCIDDILMHPRRNTTQTERFPKRPTPNPSELPDQDFYCMSRVEMVENGYKLYASSMKELDLENPNVTIGEGCDQGESMEGTTEDVKADNSEADNSVTKEAQIEEEEEEDEEKEEGEISAESSDGESDGGLFDLDRYAPLLETQMSSEEEKATIAEENRMLAMDCEMVDTEYGFELARVTIVNTKLEVILDQYVKPKNPVTNYRTAFSGIDETVLNGVSYSILDAQQDILKLVNCDTILVGHSLESDLRAVRITHEKIIDTAILFPHKVFGHKWGLKYLAKKYLNKDIRCNGGTGHDSYEDASVALELVQLKIKKGPAFGVEIVSHIKDSVFDLLAKETEVRSTLYDRKENFSNYCHGSGNYAQVSNDREVFKKLVQSLKRSKDEKEPKLMVARCADLQEYYQGLLKSQKGVSEEEFLTATLASWDEGISKLYPLLPKDTALCIVSDRGNYKLLEGGDAPEADRINIKKAMGLFVVKTEQAIS